MQYNKEKLIEEFEQEMWLLIDGTLSEPRQNYWNRKLEEMPELKEIYNETLNIILSYGELDNADIDENVYESIITRITNTKTSFFGNFLSIGGRNFIEYFLMNYKKYSLAGGLVAIVIILLTLVNQPLEMKYKSKVDLGWEADELSKRISMAEGSVQYMQYRESVDRMLYELTINQWDVARYTIENQIKNIKIELEKESL